MSFVYYDILLVYFSFYFEVNNNNNNNKREKEQNEWRITNGFCMGFHSKDTKSPKLEISCRFGFTLIEITNH